MAPKYPDGVDLWPPSLGGHKSIAKLRPFYAQSSVSTGLRGYTNVRDLKKGGGGD